MCTRYTAAHFPLDSTDHRANAFDVDALREHQVNPKPSLPIVQCKMHTVQCWFVICIEYPKNSAFVPSLPINCAYLELFIRQAKQQSRKLVCQTNVGKHFHTVGQMFIIRSSIPSSSIWNLVYFICVNFCICAQWYLHKQVQTPLFLQSRFFLTFSFKKLLHYERNIGNAIASLLLNILDALLCFKLVYFYLQIWNKPTINECQNYLLLYLFQVMILDSIEV